MLIRTAVANGSEWVKRRDAWGRYCYAMDQERGWSAPHPTFTYVWCIYCKAEHIAGGSHPCMALARGKKLEDSSSASSGQALPGKVLTAYANVLEFLSMTSWPDGPKRMTGSLRLSVEGSQWKAVVSDAENARVAFVTGDTPDALLKSLDRGLEADTLDWRADKYAQGAKKKGR